MRYLLCTIFISFNLFAYEKIVLTTHNLNPYGFYQKDGSFNGIAVKPIRYAFDKMKLDYEIKVLPWQRAQAMVQNNIAHGFFAASQNKHRDSYAILSETIADQKWNWYWIKGQKIDPFSKEFKKYTAVASFNGANMQKWLIKNNYNVTITPEDTNHAITLMLAKRFDALLANNHVMNKIIKQRNLENQFNVRTQKDKPLGVYFSKSFLKKRPGFLRDFNKYIKEYKKINKLGY